MVERTPPPEKPTRGKPGQAVYDASGNRMGYVRSVTERGFEVDARTTPDGDLTLTPDRVLARAT